MASPLTMTSFTGPVYTTDRRNRLAVFLHHVLDEIAIGDIARKAKGQRQARSGAEPADEKLRAATAPIALDVFEQERRSLLLQHTPRQWRRSRGPSPPRQ